jgi:hypothetical protein
MWCQVLSGGCGDDQPYLRSFLEYDAPKHAGREPVDYQDDPFTTF